jgi:predicted kinase
MTDEIQEGLNDPAIFKAVFLAGGPGSGKSFIVGKTALTSFGMKLVNSDNAFEKGLKDAGLSMKDLFNPKAQDVRVKASVLTKKRMGGFVEGRLGLIIDGTGKDAEKIKKQMEALEMIGYETAMIFVNTDLETALKRNKMRARSLPDDQVEKMWKGVQNNLGAFQRMFKGNMFIIDNSEGQNFESAAMSTYKKIGAWSKKLPKNRATKAWMSAEKRKRGIKEENAAAPAMNTGSIPNPADTAMGPRKKKKKDLYAKFKEVNATDRRYKPEKTVLLQRFRQFASK